ncbi:MAG TPA: hypothetical protein VN026_12100 [Bacteroidia bacterium]|jgi:hypothetical protein|nr:hypothetical protein [Bacteroidia bacterium]
MEKRNYTEDIKYLIKKRISEEEVGTNNYLLPEDMAKKVRTYMSMREDLILCSKTTVELLKLVEAGISEQHILTALWTSMIIMYSKCFTDAGFAKKSKLQIENIVDATRTDLLDIHSRIMSVRHTFVAHRGENENEQAIVYMKIPKKGEFGNTTEYNIKSLRANNFGIDNLKLSQELFGFVLPAVEKKLHVELEKIHHHIMTSYSPEILHSWLIK